MACPVPLNALEGLGAGSRRASPPGLGPAGVRAGTGPLLHSPDAADIGTSVDNLSDSRGVFTCP